jgi:hypothetical protein
MAAYLSCELGSMASAVGGWARGGLYSGAAARRAGSQRFPRRNAWRWDMNFTKNIGMLLLAIWLILTGLVVLIPAISFNGIATVLAILAIVAGVFILIGR